MLTIIKHIIEIGFSLSLFANALLFIPQILQLIKTKNSESTSLQTFSGFAVIQIFITLHGFIHRDYILAFGCMLSLVLCTTITFLIIFYRLHNKKN